MTPNQQTIMEHVGQLSLAIEKAFVANKALENGYTVSREELEAADAKLRIAVAGAFETLLAGRRDLAIVSARKIHRSLGDIAI